MGHRDLLSRNEMPKMRASCQLAARTLEMIAEHIRPGITTNEIDRLVDTFIRDHGAYPSPLNYQGFPKSVCTSINEVVCHGIPGEVALDDGDIVNVDVTCTLPSERGYFGDTSATFYVGEPSRGAIHVTEVARQALEVGIATVRPGITFGDLGFAIQQFVESKGCGVVRSFMGHGIGRTFQHVHLLPEMTVLENVAIGAHLRARRGVVSSSLSLDRAEETALLFEARTQLERVGLHRLPKPEDALTLAGHHQIAGHRDRADEAAEWQGAQRVPAGRAAQQLVELQRPRPVRGGEPGEPQRQREVLAAQHQEARQARAQQVQAGQEQEDRPPEQGRGDGEEVDRQTVEPPLLLL